MVSTELRLSADLITKLARSPFFRYLESSKIFGEFRERTQKVKLSKVAEWYKNERLVMVLGAGVSAAYGLPDWNTLLQKLLLITLKSEGNKSEEDSGEVDEKAGVIARTFTNIFEPNSLIAARYLNNHFRKIGPKSHLAFENAIRDALYGELKQRSISDLLSEIRQFCIAAGRSPNLDSIITYNYDDLIEECLKNIDVDIPFASIYSSGMKYKRNELPVYHVHGYLPQEGKLTSKNKVVLSEDGYHQQYNDVYGWSNLVQINKYKDFNCVFIGLSFSDPNFRRLLDISRNERGDDEIHHYCFRRRFNKEVVKERFQEFLDENREIVNENNRIGISIDEVAEDLTKFAERFEEKDALSFGVGSIWYEQHDDIPELLKRIRMGL